MKVLLVSSSFPAEGGDRTRRSLTLAQYLPGLGIETHVLAPVVPATRSEEAGARLVTQAWVHRVRSLGPSERVPWNLTAIPAAIRLVRAHEIEFVITASPPSSIHLIGAAAARATRARWVADLHDPPVSRPSVSPERATEWMRGRLDTGVARLASRFADAIVCADDEIAADVGRLDPRGGVVTISNRGAADLESSDQGSAFANRTAELLRSL